MSAATKSATKSAATSADKSGVSTLTTPSDREIHVERVFDAPRDRVWRAYTDPKLVAQWWGRGNKLDIQKMDLKPGGDWRYVEHSDHGEFAFHGRYREITPQDRIVQTFAWDGMQGHEIVETARFIDLGNGRTKVVSTSLFHSKDERDGMVKMGMEKGMNESYAALDRLLATLH
jgi:uncharacterized protein YndB with AHSA1/START domain